MIELIKNDFSGESKMDMPPLRIGIVEDEVVIAENIHASLVQLGYDVSEPANNYIEAISLLTKEKPDLIILDIMLNDDRDGIDLADRINKEYQIPFIFLTANADQATIQRAKGTEPSAYLIKPFTKNDLYASIEIAATRHQLHGNNLSNEGAVFVKDGNTLRKLVLHEIVRIEAERVYLQIHTIHRSFLIRRSIGQVLTELNDPRFVQVHRSHVVNLHHIDKVESTSVSLNGTDVPVSKGNRKNLTDRLQNID